MKTEITIRDAWGCWFGLAGRRSRRPGAGRRRPGSCKASVCAAILVAGTGLLLAPPSAFAAPLYSALAGVVDSFGRCVDAETQDITFPGGRAVASKTAEGTGLIPGMFGSGESGAFASSAGLGVSAFGTATGSINSNFSFSFGTCSMAEMFLDDLVISGPVGGSVTTSFSALLTGGWLAAGETNAEAGGSYFAAVRGPGGQQASAGESFAVRSDTAEANVREVLATPSFTVSVRVPFNVTMFLRTNVRGSGSRAFEDGVLVPTTGAAGSSFMDTLSFVTDGLVFDLLAGYTVNSVAGAIVDNHFVGQTAATVPEPSTLAMLSIGALAGLTLRRTSARRAGKG